MQFIWQVKGEITQPATPLRVCSINLIHPQCRKLLLTFLLIFSLYAFSYIIMLFSRFFFSFITVFMSLLSLLLTIKKIWSFTSLHKRSEKNLPDLISPWKIWSLKSCEEPFTSHMTKTISSIHSQEDLPERAVCSGYFLGPAHTSHTALYYVVVIYVSSASKVEKSMFCWSFTPTTQPLPFYSYPSTSPQNRIVCCHSNKIRYKNSVLDVRVQQITRRWDLVNKPTHLHLPCVYLCRCCYRRCCFIFSLSLIFVSFFFCFLPRVLTAKLFCYWIFWDVRERKKYHTHKKIS